MRHFPKSMIEATKEPEFWPRANELFHVTSVDKIGNPIYSGLQKEIDQRLRKHLKRIQTATYSEPARLAVGKESPTSTLRFDKFSTPVPLLKIHEDQKKLAADDPDVPPLDILLNCVVHKLGGADEDGAVHTIETSRGTLSWQGETTKVILCAGTFPKATILLNSFPECRKTVGKRIAGHFHSDIVTRVPISNFNRWSPVGSDPESNKKRKLEIAAHYLAGRNEKSNLQYHVQITAIHSPNPVTDAEDAARECPDYSAAATYDQLKDSTEHVVFVCATLGELDEKNPENYLEFDPTNPDITTNAKLQFTLAESDRELWDAMDKATFQTIEQMCTSENDKSPSADIEYWSTGGDGCSGFWSKERPSVEDIRGPGIFHESSAAYMGPGGSIDELYRPHGVQNVHVTGGAIFPTAGSWNPTLAMYGFAQHLARELTPKAKSDG